MATYKAPIGWGDADVQNQQVLRQRALADRLMQQSETPLQGQMIGNRYVAPNWAAQLANGLSGYVGGEMEKKADERQAEIAAERRRSMSEALSNFQKGLTGTPEQTIPADENPWTSTPEQKIPAKPGDAGAAYAQLLQSGIPELQQMGMQGTMETTKAKAAEAQRKAMAAILSGAKTPQEALAMGVPAADVKVYFDKSLGQEKLINVNGQPIKEYSGTAVGAPIPKQTDPTDPRKDLLIPDGKGGFVPNAPLIGVKTDLAKAGSTKVNVPVDVKNFNTQESEQSKVYGKQLGEMRGAITQAGFDAPAKLAQLSRLEKLLDGVDGGKAAPLLSDVASVAQSFGVKLDPKLGVKEAAEAVAREMAGSFRKPGTGPMTDKDFDNFLRQVPDLSKSAAGRKQITQTFRAAIERDQRAAQHAREYARQNGGVIDDNYFDSLAKFYAENPIATPALPPTNARGVPFKDPAKESRYQEWLKSQSR